MKPSLQFVYTLSLVLIVLAAHAGLAQNAPSKTLRVYHIGNSLTFGLSLDRLSKLCESEGIIYEYGTQMGAGIPLCQHVTKIHGYTRKPFKRNVVENIPVGNDHEVAFAEQNFDAVVLQPYGAFLESSEFQALAEARKEQWHPDDIGDRQAVNILIRRALGDNAKNNKASSRFYIYGTWPRVLAMNPPRGDAKTYVEHWTSAYTADLPSPMWGVPTRDFQQQLVKLVNEDNPDLQHPVRLIPAGDVLAALDVVIRDGKLPGFEQYMTRDTIPLTASGEPAKTWNGPARPNREYYRTARLSENKKTGELELVRFFPFEKAYDPSYGVINLYCDGIHMNDQPHAGPTDGTLGAYAAALTVYTVLTGRSPVGVTTAPWERIDPVADRELVNAVQHIVWDVVRNEPLTGVTP